MKFYIAGRYSDEPSRLLIQDMTATLTKLGHECTFNWTQRADCKPYENNVELTRQSATFDANAVLECKLFIMVSHPEGTGMYVEYGIALAENLRTGMPKMYLTGDHKNCSLFNYHPNVLWRDSLEEIIAEISEK